MIGRSSCGLGGGGSLEGMILSFPLCLYLHYAPLKKECQIVAVTMGAVRDLKLTVSVQVVNMLFPYVTKYLTNLCKSHVTVLLHHYAVENPP